MPLRCILVPTGPGMDPSQRLEAALRVAGRTHAHIELMFVRPDAQSLLASLPEFATGITEASIERDGKDAAERAHNAFLAWCDAKQVPMDSNRRLDATFASWREEVGDIGSKVALIGRVQDLIVVDIPRRIGPFIAEAFDAAVFSSGRPALVIGDHMPDDLLRHVVIAWNGSLEGARTIGQSIALLHEAAHVTIFTVPGERANESSLADLGRYLRWHGIVAGPPIVEFDGGSVGEALLATCRKQNASLLVMGAYTHSRVRQMLLGGVTRHVLDNASMPILMAH